MTTIDARNVFVAKVLQNNQRVWSVLIQLHLESLTNDVISAVEIACRASTSDIDAIEAERLRFINDVLEELGVSVRSRIAQLERRS